MQPTIFCYTMPRFARENVGMLTFQSNSTWWTACSNCLHEGKVIFRMSVNPQPLIARYELGPNLKERTSGGEQHGAGAGYHWLFLRRLLLVEGWKRAVHRTFGATQDRPDRKNAETNVPEVILMTYSFVHRAINNAAFPNTPDLHDGSLMIGRERENIATGQSKGRSGIMLRTEIKGILGNVAIRYIS